MEKGAELKSNYSHSKCTAARSRDRKKWRRPKLEVSGKVMAQPYIRFT